MTSTVLKVYLLAICLAASVSSKCYCGRGGICHVLENYSQLPDKITCHAECFLVTGSIYGSDCQTLFDACWREPCKNGGTCFQVLGSYFCRCPTDYVGVDCSIFDPYFKAERLDGVYLYYQIHSLNNDARNIYVGVDDFGEGFVAQINFVDFQTIYTLTEFDFEWINLRSMCTGAVSTVGDDNDPAICQLLPDRDVLSAVIPFKSIREINPEAYRALTMKIRGSLEVVANLDFVNIKLLNYRHPAFQKSYSMISYVSQLEILCDHKISITGCSNNRSDILIFPKHEELVLEVIIEKLDERCFPIKEISKKWFHIRHVKLLEIAPGQNSQSVKIPGNSLERGVHEFQFEYRIGADPPHFGADYVIKSIGRCFIDVYEGSLELAIKGGSFQVLPCNSFFKLEAINLNLNYQVQDMNFTWSCSGREKMCAPVHTQGFAEYPGSKISCGSVYAFRLTVWHPIARMDLYTEVQIQFKPHKLLKITCVRNCISKASHEKPVLLEIQSIPFVKAITWNITMENGTAAATVEPDVLRLTQAAGFLYFASHTFPNKDTSYRVHVTTSGVTAYYILQVRKAPSPSKCKMNRVETASNNFTYDIICERHPVLGFFHLFEVQSAITRSAIATSTSGKFTNVEILFNGVAVYFMDFKGSASLTYNFFQNNFEYYKDLGPVLRLKLERAFVSGDYMSVLRIMNVATYQLMVAERGELRSEHASIIAFHILSSLLKMEFSNKQARQECAFSVISMIMASEDSTPIIPTRNRFLSAMILEEISYLTLLKTKSEDMLHLFWTYSNKFIARMIDSFVATVMKKDLFMSIPIDERNVIWRQSLKRMNEAASVKLMKGFKYLGQIYRPWTVRMGEPLLFDTRYMGKKVRFWCAAGSLDFITGEYLKTDEPQFAITGNQSFTSGPFTESTSITFEIFHFAMDLLWWHRTETFHTGVLYAKLYDDVTGSSSPPSHAGFEVKLNILEEFRHLLDGTVLSGSCIATDDDSLVTRFSYVPPAGISRIYYEVKNCSSLYGCRVVISEEQPTLAHFTMGNATKGCFITRWDGETKLNYYLGILPGHGEIPGKIVNFSVWFITGSCKTWKDYRNIEYCEFDRFNGTQMIGRALHMSGFGMSIVHPLFTSVTNLVANLIAPTSYRFEVMLVTILTTAAFVGFLFLAKNRENEDSEKRFLREVPKISPSQNWPYIVAVYTGRTLWSTTSSVAIRFRGNSIGTTGLIKKPGWKTLKSGNEDWFLFSTRDHVGEIDEIHIWHDHSGCSPDWFCERIIVYDVMDSRIHEFSIRKLLTVTEPFESSKFTVVESRLVYSFEENVRLKGKFFRKTWKTELLNKHRLLSVFFKHPRAGYTRTQLLVMLWVYVVSIMGGSLLFLIATTRDSGNGFQVTELILSSIFSFFWAYVPAATVNWLFRVVASTVISLHLVILCIFGQNVNSTDALKWALVCLICLLTMFLIIEPIKLTILSWILVHYLRKTDIEVYSLNLETTSVPFENLSTRNFIEFIAEGTNPAYKPLLSSTIEKIIEKRKKRRRCLSIVTLSLVTLVLVLLVTVLIGYSAGLMAHISYHTLSFIKRVHSGSHRPYQHNVFSKNRIIYFIVNTFIRSVNKRSWYNGQSLNASPYVWKIKFEKEEHDVSKGLFIDYSSSVLGYFRITQHRISSSNKDVPKSFKKYFEESLPPLQTSTIWNNMDTRDYCEGWTEVEGCRPSTRLWRFNRNETSLAWRSNQTMVYPYSGYSQDIHWSTILAFRKFINLLEDNWVDNKTRSFIIEFSLGNRYTRSVSAGGILIEVLASGVITSKLNMESTSMGDEIPEYYSEDKFVDFIKVIRRHTPMTYCAGLAALALVLAICNILPRLWPSCDRVSSCSKDAARIVLAAFLVALYVHYLWLNSSQGWEMFLTETDTQERDPQDEARKRSTILFYGETKIPLFLGFCVALYTWKRAVLPQPPVRQKTSRAQTIPERTTRFSSKLTEHGKKDSLHPKLTKLNLKFNKLKPLV